MYFLWSTGIVIKSLVYAADEVTHAFSLCPVRGESKLLCGLKSQIREFDLNLPGEFILMVALPGKNPQNCCFLISLLN